MGYTLPSDEKKKMENRFRDLRKTLTEELRNEKTGEELRVAVERGLLDFYNDEDEMKTIRKKFKTSRFEHGIAIGVEKDKTITGIQKCPTFFLGQKKVPKWGTCVVGELLCTFFCVFLS